MLAFPALDHSDLLAAAHAVRAQSHSPYSRYPVGAALLARDGRVFVGANVENRSYGLALCAERSAIATAISAGAREFAAIAVVTSSSPPAAPCGLCRETLAEFCTGDFPIVLGNDRGETRETTLGALFPDPFVFPA